METISKETVTETVAPSRKKRGKRKKMKAGVISPNRSLTSEQILNFDAPLLLAAAIETNSEKINYDMEVEQQTPPTNSTVIRILSTSARNQKVPIILISAPKSWLVSRVMT